MRGRIALYLQRPLRRQRLAGLRGRRAALRSGRYADRRLRRGPVLQQKWHGSGRHVHCPPRGGRGLRGQRHGQRNGFEHDLRGWHRVRPRHLPASRGLRRWPAMRLGVLLRVDRQWPGLCASRIGGTGVFGRYLRVSLRCAGDLPGLREMWDTACRRRSVRRGQSLRQIPHLYGWHLPKDGGRHLSGLNAATGSRGQGRAQVSDSGT